MSGHAAIAKLKTYKVPSKAAATHTPCVECRRRKIRCDGLEPCGQCQWYQPGKCAYAKPNQRGGRPIVNHAYCQSCRFNKLRCDGARPNCQRCSDESHECSYAQHVVETLSDVSATWERGRTPKRDVQTRRSPSPGQPPQSFTNRTFQSTSTDYDLHCSVPTRSSSVCSSSSVRSMIDERMEWAHRERSQSAAREPPLPPFPYQQGSSFAYDHAEESLGGTTSFALLASDSQAGPHKCSRVNPSTGKPCKWVFWRPYDLTRHEDVIHNNRKMKVRCPYCREEKTFSRDDVLAGHMRVIHPEIDGARHHPITQTLHAQRHLDGDSLRHALHNTVVPKATDSAVLELFRCKFQSCTNQKFPSTAWLLRHEREAHAMYGHVDRPFLCFYTDCERSLPGNGFPRRYNLHDHMKRIHDHEDESLSVHGRPGSQGAETSNNVPDGTESGPATAAAEYSGLVGTSGTLEDPGHNIQALHQQQERTKPMPEISQKIAEDTATYGAELLRDSRGYSASQALRRMLAGDDSVLAAEACKQQLAQTRWPDMESLLMEEPSNLEPDDIVGLNCLNRKLRNLEREGRESPAGLLPDGEAMPKQQENSDQPSDMDQAATARSGPPAAAKPPEEIADGSADKPGQALQQVSQSTSSTDFRCRICDKRFTRLTTLRNHQRSHTGEKPFVCKAVGCGRSFRQRNEQRRHKDTQHGAKKLQCGEDRSGTRLWGCGKWFARRDGLQEHHTKTEKGKTCWAQRLRVVGTKSD